AGGPAVAASSAVASTLAGSDALGKGWGDVTPMPPGDVSSAIAGRSSGSGRSVLASAGASIGAGDGAVALTSGSADVVAGSAMVPAAAAGVACRISTSIAWGMLGGVLPGPGSVISIGSIAATQSPCTAPAPSTQRGRVIERLPVKVREFQGRRRTFAPRPPL